MVLGKRKQKEGAVRRQKEYRILLFKDDEHGPVQLQITFKKITLAAVVGLAVACSVPVLAFGLFLNIRLVKEAEVARHQTVSSNEQALQQMKLDNEALSQALEENQKVQDAQLKEIQELQVMAESTRKKLEDIQIREIEVRSRLGLEEGLEEGLAQAAVPEADAPEAEVASDGTPEAENGQTGSSGTEVAGARAGANAPETEAAVANGAGTGVAVANGAGTEVTGTNGTGAEVAGANIPNLGAVQAVSIAQGQSSVVANALPMLQQSYSVLQKQLDTKLSDYSDLSKQITINEQHEQQAIETREAVVAYALQFVGGEYEYGGNDPQTGVDCSGFTRYVLSHAGGTYLNRTAAAQSGQGSTVSISQAKPGDLIFYSNSSYINHVAIYIGDGRVVHASTEKTGIITSDWNYRTPVKIQNVLGD